MIARFRPPNKTEIASGGEHIVDYESEDTCKINVTYLVLSDFTREHALI